MGIEAVENMGDKLAVILKHHGVIGVGDSLKQALCACVYLEEAAKTMTGKRSTAVCKFLGDISYPIYITHYPLVYTYTAWVCNNNATMVEGIPYMILTFVGAVVLAYACLKLYDEPVRRWLTDRFLKGKKK